MGKEERIKRKADKEAAKSLQVPTQADVDALKQKSLEEGAYSIDPNTGKPIGEVNLPKEKVAVQESTNLKNFEGTSRLRTAITDKPYASPSDIIPDDNEYLQSGNIKQAREEVAGMMDSPYISKRYEATGETGMTPGEIDASIAQAKKEAADRFINRDAEAAKLASPEEAAAIDYNAAQLKTNNTAVGDEKMNNILNEEKPVTAVQQVFDKYEQTGDESVLAGITLNDVEKIKESADEDMLLGMDEQAANQYKQYKKIVEKFGPKPEPAIEKLGVTDYYPDMGQPLQVGSYSGSIVGSIPIFTAKGGVLPMGVYDARRRALQKQADDKEKQRLQLFEMAKMAAAPQYQQELDDEAYSTINDYLKAVNYNITPGDENWMALHQNLNRINNVKKGTLEIQTWTNKILEDLSKPDRFVPEYKQKLAAEWLRGGYTMSDLINDPKKQKKLYNLRNEIKSYDNLSHYTADYVQKLKESKSTVPLAANFRDKLSEIPATQQDELIASAADGDFNKFMTLTMTYMPDSDIALHAKKLWESSDFADKEGTPEQVAKNAGEYLEYFNTFIGKEIIPKVTILKNNRLGWAELARKNRLDEKQEKSRIYETYKINTFNSDSKRQLIDAAKNGTLKQTLENMTGLGQAKTDKNGVIFQEIKIPMKEGQKGQVTLNDLSVIRVGGKAFKPEQAYNYYSKYSDAFFAQTNDNGEITGYQYKPMVTGGLPELSADEMKFAEYIAHNKKQGNTNIGLNTQFTKGNVYQKGSSGKAMKEDDYKNEQEVINARPYASLEASVGFYDAAGKWNNLGTGVQTYDLTNDANVAGMDNFVSGSNTEYGYGIKQTQGTTSDVGEESDVMVYDNDLED